MGGRKKVSAVRGKGVLEKKRDVVKGRTAPTSVDKQSLSTETIKPTSGQ